MLSNYTICDLTYTLRTDIIMVLLGLEAYTFVEVIKFVIMNKNLFIKLHLFLLQGVGHPMSNWDRKWYKIPRLLLICCVAIFLSIILPGIVALRTHTFYRSDLLSKLYQLSIDGELHEEQSGELARKIKFVNDLEYLLNASRERLAQINCVNAIESDRSIIANIESERQLQGKILLQIGDAKSNLHVIPFYISEYPILVFLSLLSMLVVAFMFRPRLKYLRKHSPENKLDPILSESSDSNNTWGLISGRIDGMNRPISQNELFFVLDQCKNENTDFDILAIYSKLSNNSDLSLDSLNNAIKDNMKQRSLRSISIFLWTMFIYLAQRSVDIVLEFILPNFSGKSVFLYFDRSIGNINLIINELPIFIGCFVIVWIWLDWRKFDIRIRDVILQKQNILTSYIFHVAATGNIGLSSISRTLTAIIFNRHSLLRKLSVGNDESNASWLKANAKRLSTFEHTAEMNRSLSIADLSYRFRDWQIRSIILGIGYLSLLYIYYDFIVLHNDKRYIISAIAAQCLWGLTWMIISMPLLRSLRFWGFIRTHTTLSVSMYEKNFSQLKNVISFFNELQPVSDLKIFVAAFVALVAFVAPIIKIFNP